MDRKSVFKNLVNLYGLDWEYNLSYKNNKYLLKITKQIKKKLKKEFLSKLKYFKDFKILFGNLNTESLGCYINGSCTWKPVLLLDLNIIEYESMNTGLSYNLIIETTILHEIAHAIQDKFHLNFNEKKAEKFAKTYYTTGKILAIR